MSVVEIAPEAEDVFLAPTLATTFVGCKQAAAWDLEVSRKLRDKPREAEEMVLLSRKGAEHERACREALEVAFGTVYDPPRHGDWETRLDRTVRAMADGAPVIAQGAVKAGPWAGYADFLVRVDEPCARWAWSYEPWDAKLARTARPEHVLQLCFYGDMLAAIQGRAPVHGRLMLGGVLDVEPEDHWEDLRGCAVARFRLSDFRYYARRIARGLEGFSAAPMHELNPEPCAACPTCRWQDDCAHWWDDVDHLCRTADITRLQMRRLRAAGIRTLTELAMLNEATDVPRMAWDTLDRLIRQARLQKRTEECGEGVYELLDCEADRGFGRLPEPDPGDVFFDFEGDPLHPGGLEYLCGVLWREERESEPRFQAFWAHDRDSEKQSFSVLMTFLTEHLARHPGAHLYHYAPYERTALCRLASMHGVHEEDVDDLLRGNKLVDLYRVVREALRVGERSYSIKALERFYMEKRKTEVVSGGESIVVYERWRQTRDDSLLERIRDYNRDDCFSTLGLRDWLLGIRRPRAASGIPAVAPEQVENDPKAAEDRARREAAALEQAELEARLLDCPAEEHGFRQCVADLVGFHRREAKPVWWAFFDRHDRSPGELIDDGECLGACKADGDDWIGADKKSRTYRYRFPEQETKLRAGKDVYAAGDLKRPVGRILAVDEEARTVTIKRGPSYESSPPDSLSLVPKDVVPDEELRAAVRRVAEDVAAGGNQFLHIGALLRREPPSLDGRTPGAPLIPSEICADPDGLLEAAKEAVLALRGTWLFIQGPPGAGKTYLSSHLILALLRAGKRVGVSSNSHKAIDNLLRAVEKRAEECGFTDWRGQNKTDGEWQGHWIESVAKPDKIDPGADLVAGTAWLFARETLESCRDVLFVDEAGQVSLGHLVAMARAARAIVLVGDQMQLGQPIQGAHPRESGLSVLEFLLGGDPVIAPERGIFLPLTWRMHPHLCRFISQAVYDGRLDAERGCAAQGLVLDDAAHPALKPTGLAFLEVVHEGNGQRSEEEAGEVAAIYENLLRQRVTDRHGRTRPIAPEDVLVIAPYNMQVNLLRRRLGADARIGTVDKFQGQEAEVVLVSMATSGIDEMPRDVSFLLSRNRLNVALSRARCLAVVFASPGLLDMPVRTVEEMRLANTLCWAREYADSESADP